MLRWAASISSNLEARFPFHSCHEREGIVVHSSLSDRTPVLYHGRTGLPFHSCPLDRPDRAGQGSLRLRSSVNHLSLATLSTAHRGHFLAPCPRIFPKKCSRSGASEDGTPHARDSLRENVQRYQDRLGTRFDNSSGCTTYPL